MKKVNVQTYNIKEVKESLERYLDFSASRLRARLKNAWKRQTTVKQLMYDKRN